ncbi:hypothetical protein BDL97_18G068300 [Sphagnum fallax]|nr:hypothetical protein BDL97_18G068300 [Sphagnum fallax]
MEPAQRGTPLPLADLDDYMQETIFHMLGGGCKSSSARQNSSKSLVQYLHQRIRELEHKSAKSKEEACLNAQALKRQVAESQKMAEQCKALTQECARLGNECTLYHNDCEIFQEAADEAEDRATSAEQRATAAEQKTYSLALELESLKQSSGTECNIQLEIGDSIIGLRSRLAELEVDNQCLQKELMKVEAEAKCYMQSLTELQEMQNASKMMEALKKDEHMVHSAVSSAVMAGVVRALEEERDDIVCSLNLQLRTARTKAELGAYQEWMKVADRREQALVLEEQDLEQELAMCKSNLEKAEDEVQLLADENKELRWMLRFRCSSCSNHINSPLLGKGVRIIASSHPIESFLTNVVDKRRQQYQQQGNISLPCKATNQSATYTINNILLSVVQWCTTHTLV